MKENLPHRKRIRLLGYDYSTEGYYFITICTKNKSEILGKIDDMCRGGNLPSAEMKLSEEGKIVEKYIKEISNIYNNVNIDEYVIMPNHIHMILTLQNSNENDMSKIIGQLKRKVSMELKYSIWQKLFYEHIIRNDKEYYKIKEYIRTNIKKWKEDRYSGRLIAAPTNKCKFKKY